MNELEFMLKAIRNMLIEITVISKSIKSNGWDTYGMGGFVDGQRQERRVDGDVFGNADVVPPPQELHRRRKWPAAADC